MFPSPTWAEIYDEDGTRIGWVSNVEGDKIKSMSSMTFILKDQKDELSAPGAISARTTHYIALNVVTRVWSIDHMDETRLGPSVLKTEIARNTPGYASIEVDHRRMMTHYRWRAFMCPNHLREEVFDQDWFFPADLGGPDTETLRWQSRHMAEPPFTGGVVSLDPSAPIRTSTPAAWDQKLFEKLVIAAREAGGEELRERREGKSAIAAEFAKAMAERMENSMARDMYYSGSLFGNTMEFVINDDESFS